MNPTLSNPVMKTCPICGESKDSSLFSDKNPNICCVCEFGMNIDQQEQDEAKGFVRPTKRQIAITYLQYKKEQVRINFLGGPKSPSILPATRQSDIRTTPGKSRPLSAGSQFVCKP